MDRSSRQHRRARIAAPLTLGCALAAAYLLLPLLELYRPVETFLREVLRTGFLVDVFWALLRLVDIAVQAVSQTPWAKGHPASRSLVPLGARIAKVVVLAMAVIAILSNFGYPVASLVAGLGIGGLALALAAQKTVENLFGALSIGVDQPFREGDTVGFDNVVGTVERIGLRSTRVRTDARTVVSIPNGKLADMRVESYAPRDRIRFAVTLGLVYSTTAAQVRAIRAELERILQAQPKLFPEGLSVRLVGLGESSLNLEVMAYFATADWGEYQLIREDVLLLFMEAVEKNGSAFAFPSRTVYLAGERR